MKLMNRMLGPLLGLLVLAMAIFCWLAFRGEGEDEEAVPGRTDDPSISTDRTVEPDVVDVAHELTSPEIGEARAERSPAVGDDVGSGAGQWVEGRIVFPLASPIDDDLAVLAFVTKGDDPLLPALRSDDEPRWWPDVERFTGIAPRSTEVDTEGRFRLALPEKAEQALLFLDGRYLYLHRGLPIDLPRMREVILEPELGGCLHVRCLPPESATDGGKPLALLEIDLRGYDPRGGFSFEGLHRRTALTDSEHVAEFRALPAHYDYFVLGDPPTYAANRDVGIPIEPGQLVEKELRFSFGADYSGRVIDEDGEPVADSLVWIAPPDPRMGFGPGTRRETHTDVTGAFRIVGARVGPVVVTAEREDLCSARTETIWGEAGGSTEDLVLELKRGLAIRGRVLLPDGSPAVEAGIELAPSAPGGGAAQTDQPHWRETLADGGGEFSFTGLEQIEYEIVAEARSLRARRSGVVGGTEDLVLQLRESGTLTGIVVGDDESPIASFRLEFWPEGRSEERLAAAFASEDGRFEVEGLFEGPWHLEARADGWLSPPDDMTFDYPVPVEGLTVVLERAARVAGIVRNAAGVPVAKSDVVLTGAGADSERSPVTGRGLPVAEKRTSGDGAFVLQNVRSGVYELRADHEAHAPSETIALELMPGDTIDDLELRLAAGGAITGEVYDEAGAPDAGRRINCDSNLAGDSGSAVTDAAGGFEIGPLAAGPYSVYAPPTKEELERIQREGSDLTELASITRSTEVEVIDEDTVHVVLGAPRVAPIYVFGTVTEAGAPVAGGSVSIVPAGGGFSDRVDTKVESDGTYELQVEQAGDVVLLYHRQIYRTPGLDFPTRIPPGDEYRFDIELPTGSIEGVVIGVDGEPASGVSITLTRDSGLSRPTFYGPARGGVTNEDGSFLHTGLEPGTFSLRVPGRTMRPGVSYGAAVVTDVVVREGERTSGVLIQLVGFGTLTGRVLDSGGNPVPEAAIFVRDPEGRILQPLTLCETDPSGRFRYEGLPTGELLVNARGATEAGPIEGPVSIEAGEEVEVELHLAGSTILHVLTEDARGEPLRARVHLFDASGRDHAGLGSIPAIVSGRARTSTATDHRIGPVPAGVYRLEAISEHGRIRRQELELGATLEHELHLRFDE